MTYELLSHTADVKFRSHGGSLEEAFSEAVEAFSEIVRQEREVEATGTRVVVVESENLEALLFDFLDKLIYVQDADGYLVLGADDLEIQMEDTGYSLRASLRVTEIRKGMGLLDIKGPTYNDMRVEEDDGWVLEAVLDI